MYDEYEQAFRSQLLENIYELTPYQFEQFARKILQAYGFIDIKVTSVSSDGCIDGYGKLRLGLAMMNVAYKFKRWEGNVGRPEDLGAPRRRRRTFSHPPQAHPPPQEPADTCGRAGCGSTTPTGPGRLFSLTYGLSGPQHAASLPQAVEHHNG